MGSPGKRRADVRATRRASGVAFWQAQARKVVLPAVGLGALAIASAAVVAGPGVPASSTPSQSAASQAANPERITIDASEVSRGGERPVLTTPAQFATQATGSLWVVADAELRSDAAADAPVLASVESGSQVQVTGVVEGEWTQVLHNDLPRWIATSAVTSTEPIGTAACATGSDVERGLQPDTIKVHRAVCAKFPEITTYGGLGQRSNKSGHPTGHALDIMVRGSLGDEIAQYVIDNADRLGVSQVIWEQKIWEPRSGWRGMEDRGGDTANHVDHVHVTVYGDAATG